MSWKSHMHTILQALHQWGMVESTVMCLAPEDVSNITATKTVEIEAWDVRSIMAFMEISFWVGEGCVGQHDFTEGSVEHTQEMLWSSAGRSSAVLGCETPAHRVEWCYRSRDSPKLINKSVKVKSLRDQGFYD